MVQGCEKGFHSNEKPAPESTADQKPLPEEIIIRGPPPKQATPSERPPVDEKMTELPKTVAQTLQQALEKLLADMKLKASDQAAGIT